MRYPFHLFILALFFSCVGTDEITIEKIDLSVEENITITQSSEALLVGQEAVFTAIYTNTRGETEDVILEWVSSTPSIATINLNGVASALSEGNTNIIAKYQDIESNKLSLNVSIDATDLATIEVSGSETMLYLGETTILSAKPFDLDGNQLLNITYSWISNDEKLATIDIDGKVTASSANTGKASFHAIAEGKISNTYYIDIIDKTVLPIRNGTFEGYSGYSVSGSVTLEQQEGEDLTLKFDDDFLSVEGPGLFIYLSNSKTQVIEQGIEIQPLGKLSGAFEINISEINPNIMLSEYQYVIIHCKPFNVPFGGALLNEIE